ncbi:MAG TPA: hypothetical protein VG318_09770 [Actinomycetota bacterium]|nr:hypothetical protein [Actinomycetota bacterium]
MRRTAATAATALLMLAACGGDAAGSEAFCDATRDALAQGDTEEAPPELDTMVEEAPDEIRDDATIVRDGFKDAFENQDLAAIQTDEFTEAAENLGEFADENCEGVQEE